jgi:hypothetical protein
MPIRSKYCRKGRPGTEHHDFDGNCNQCGDDLRPFNPDGAEVLVLDSPLHSSSMISYLSKPITRYVLINQQSTVKSSPIADHQLQILRGLRL